MLRRLVLFLLLLHLQHIWKRTSTSKTASTRGRCGAAAPHRALLPVQHVLLGEDPQTVFEGHLAGGLLWGSEDQSDAWTD